MNEFINFFTQAIAQSPDYPIWLYWVTLAGIVGLTQITKLPIKYFIKKIKKESRRERIEAVIMLLPICFGILANYLYTFLGYPFVVDVGIRWGLGSVALYIFISKLFNRIKNNEEITKETIEEDATEAISETKTAEEEFNQLVEKYTKKEKVED